MYHKTSTGKKWRKPSNRAPSNTGSSIGRTIWGRCHMATETASHILYECVGLVESIFCCLVKLLMQPRDYDEFPLCKILYFEVRHYWRNKVNREVQYGAVQGSPYEPKPLIRTLILNVTTLKLHVQFAR